MNNVRLRFYYRSKSIEQTGVPYSLLTIALPPEYGIKFKDQDWEDEINLILFRSDLANESRSEIIYIIAHELAHAFLEFKDNVSKKRREIEADKQVIKWGFEKELWESDRSYLEKEKRKKGDREAIKTFIEDDKQGGLKNG